MTGGPIPPLAPQGVEVVHPDGERIPVELEFHGVTADGIFAWGIATEIDWQRGDAIEADTWPSIAMLAVPSGWVETMRDDE